MQCAIPLSAPTTKNRRKPRTQAARKKLPAAPNDDSRYRRLLDAARHAFRSADPEPEARAYLWLCDVLAIPASQWQTNAKELLALYPERTANLPLPVRWCRACLQTLTAGVDTVMPGIIDLCAMHGDGAGSMPLTGALLRAAEAARTSEHRDALRRTVQDTLADAARKELPVLRSLLEGLTLRCIDPDAGPDEAERLLTETDMGPNGRRLANIYRGLARNDAAVVEECVPDDKEADEDLARLCLVGQGILAALAGQVEEVANVRGRCEGVPEAAWDLLQTAAGLHGQKHDAAVHSAMNLLVQWAQGKTDDISLPDPSALLAFVGIHGNPETRRHGVDLVASADARRIAQDPSLPSALLRTACLAGDDQKILARLAGEEHLAELARDDVHRLYSHLAVVALCDRDYELASKNLLACRGEDT